MLVVCLTSCALHSVCESFILWCLTVLSDIYSIMWLNHGSYGHPLVGI